MKKILFTFICAFIALGWMGCDSHKHGHFSSIYCIEIDSAATCCGIDSFVIKSPWIQERINAYLADSAKHKEELFSTIEYKCFTDSIGNDYIIENKIYLYDCEGVMVTVLGTSDGPLYPWEYPMKTLVNIVMGLEPHI